MAIGILAYDIPGSSYTGRSPGCGNYKKERAVRRFLVDGQNTFDKASILNTFIGLIDDASGHDLHPQTQVSNANLPLQELTIQKVGNRPNDATGFDSGSTGALYIIEAVYYYAL